MPKNIKYLHILRGELKFSTPLIDMLQPLENDLEGNEHYFIIHDEKTYAALSEKFKNTIYYKPKDARYAVAEIINAYGENCRWMIIHGFEDLHSLYKIKRRYYKKIIWRTWGGDNGINIYGSLPQRLLRQAYNRLVFVPFARGIYAIGVANIADEIALDKAIGKGKQRYYPMYYNKSVNTVPKEKKDNGKRQGLNIMVGHSAYESDSHIEILRMLEKFKDEDIKIYIPLSYGKEAVKKQVSAYAKEHFSKKAVVLDSFMPMDEYYGLLYSMDIGILPATISYALANVMTYLNGGKTVYLARNGILAEAFDTCGIPYKKVEDIKNMTFEEFSTLCTGVSNKLAPAGENMGIKYWRELLDILNK